MNAGIRDLAQGRRFCLPWPLFVGLLGGGYEVEGETWRTGGS